MNEEEHSKASFTILATLLIIGLLCFQIGLQAELIQRVGILIKQKSPVDTSYIHHDEIIDTVIIKHTKLASAD